MPSLQREKTELTNLYHRHVDMVYRLCYSYMKNRSDTEDMVQETFLRYLSRRPSFANVNHEKAWLIVTASNLCKDSLKRKFRTSENIDDYLELEAEQKQEDAVLELILQLPDEYKQAVYMYYYEGYTTAEIAEYVKAPESTVRSRLSRAKQKLQVMMGGAGR